MSCGSHKSPAWLRLWSSSAGSPDKMRSAQHFHVTLRWPRPIRCCHHPLVVNPSLPEWWRGAPQGLFRSGDLNAVHNQLWFRLRLSRKLLSHQGKRPSLSAGRWLLNAIFCILKVKALKACVQVCDWQWGTTTTFVLLHSVGESYSQWTNYEENRWREKGWLSVVSWPYICWGSHYWSRLVINGSCKFQWVNTWSW